VVVDSPSACWLFRFKVGLSRKGGAFHTHPAVLLTNGARASSAKWSRVDATFFKWDKEILPSDAMIFNTGSTLFIEPVALNSQIARTGLRGENAPLWQVDTAMSADGECLPAWRSGVRLSVGMRCR